MFRNQKDYRTAHRQRERAKQLSELLPTADCGKTEITDCRQKTQIEKLWSQTHRGGVWTGAEKVPVDTVETFLCARLVCNRER